MTCKGPGDHGMESYDFFLLKKAHLCVNVRRLSHFAWRSVGGLTLRAEREKVWKSRTPIGMMSRRYHRA